MLAQYRHLKEKDEALKDNANPQGDKYELFRGDFRTLCQSLESNSIDCIITDPPYSESYLQLNGDLAEMASRLLKQGGSLLIISGLMFLPQLLAQVEHHLSYQWTLAFVMGTGTARVWQRKVCQAWKPILWFVKGKYEGPWVTDVIRSGLLEKELDDWQQPQMVSDKLISDFAKPNETILDPMMGTGTTGVSAVLAGMHFIGCELDKDKFAIAKRRLHNAIEGISE